MEVATTNNHHSHHHHHLGHQLHHPTATQHLPMAKEQQKQQQQKHNLHRTVSSTPPTITTAPNASSNSPHSPFQREVREWQRVDPDTGALLSGRLEADRWINGPLNKYGKISDSQNIAQPNGTQHTQRKQFEVLQTRTANGAVQVIRTHTIQTSSSRSWSSSNSNSASTSASASASASPICIINNGSDGNGNVNGNVNGNSNDSGGTETGGGGFILLHSHNITNDNNNTHTHSTSQQHLTAPNDHWHRIASPPPSPPQPPNTAALNISEVSCDDYDLEKVASTALSTLTLQPYIVEDCDNTDDDDHNHDRDNHDDVKVCCDYSISRSSSGSVSGNKGQTSNATKSSSSLQSQSSVRLLPDTAPSFKLSNLMKSGSGGSSSNSSTTMNTHNKSAATSKVSLHAIFGGANGDGDVNNNNNKRTNNEATKSSKSTGTVTTTTTTTTTAAMNGTVPGTKTWQQQQEQQQRNFRHLEQATLFGQYSNSSRSRVGVVTDCNCNDDGYTPTTTTIADADETRLHYEHQQHKHKQKNELSQTATPTRRRDLESFRHNAGSKANKTTTLEAETAKTTITTVKEMERETDMATDDKAGKHDDLRLSTRQLRRQQQPFDDPKSANGSSIALQRSHSISTDDLSNDWESTEASAESNEWRRVSKLRRSFQSSSSSVNSNSKNSANNNNTNNNSSNNKNNDQLNQASASSSLSRRRPFDLPTSSVSVARIRAELESGRRLTTAMRNNHVDLVALESALQGGQKEFDPTARESKKSNDLLTAESLKEIRARLKKLSDESLYKDDFIVYQQPPEAYEHIEVQQSMRRKLSTPRLQQLTPDQSLEITTITQEKQQEHPAHHSVFEEVHTQRRTPQSVVPQLYGLTHSSDKKPQHTSHSLQSRQKLKESGSTEWHSRRKSYGFEKMSPPDTKSIGQMDASTDSGLGRSSELGNWSPTETTPSTGSATATARATIIQFGEPTNTAIQPQYHPRVNKSPARRTPDDDLTKRHSIAVDESQYVRDNLRKTSQVHLKGFYEPTDEIATAQGSALFQRSAQNAQKRVEFCKTEVHFAAESGRVNIVETDGKPPPTNNFRRRRRTTSGPLQSLTKSVVSTVVTNISTPTTSAATTSTSMLFGDVDDDHQQRHRTIASSLVAYKATLVDGPSTGSEFTALPAATTTTSVTVSVQKMSGDVTDNENDDTTSGIRGILKNKPIKPKPYHLGENIDSTDALWGIQLKPVAGSVSNTIKVSGREKDDSPTAILQKSVAERVRIVEKRHEHTAQNGYSTKINLSLDEPTQAIRNWPQAGLPTKLTPITDRQFNNHPINTQRRPSAQELILQDLREHQRMLDEGLKSTSLIIKTMRSANEFDEAMRRLSIATPTIMPPIVVPTPMLHSNSYQETIRRLSNASLENTEREITTHMILNTQTKTNEDTTSTTTMSRRLSYENASAFVTPASLQLPPAPLIAPRLKLIGSSDVMVSQKLSQLRRMYDIAAIKQNVNAGNHNDDDLATDSADEEVKSYFCAQENEQSGDSGGGTLESSSQEDERAIEYLSGSWCRLKAKRTIWKIEAEEVKKMEPIVLDKADLPKSNIMSIELHSPQISKRESFKRSNHQTVPVAKPRTIASAINSTPDESQSHQLKPSVEHFNRNDPQRDSLKIVKEVRGARKLREHELSYFGVPHIHESNNNEVNESKTKFLSNTNTNITSLSKRTLPSRRQHQLTNIAGNEDTKQRTRSHDIATNKQTTNATATTTDIGTNEKTFTKWQLLNDKPDLLCHSPTVNEAQQQTSKVFSNDIHNDNDKNNDDNQSDHYYENILNGKITPVFKVKSPQPYDRKLDLTRDEYILNEMNENADITMKSLSDEAAHKDRRRRRRSSRHRRESIPLETIDEKVISHKPSDSCIAVKMSRGTLASEAKRHTRPATNSTNPNDMHNSRVRTSSQSSVESCPRARSRSLSSEREYENIPIIAKTTQGALSSATKSHARPSSGGVKQQHRSSSRDSQRSVGIQYSSGDEIGTREEQRVRLKSKRGTANTNATPSRSSERHRSRKEIGGDHDHHRNHDAQRHHSVTRIKQEEEKLRAASSTTHASQREERAECTSVSQPQHANTKSGHSSGSSKRRGEHAIGEKIVSGNRERHAISRGGTDKTRSGGSAGIRLFRSLRGRTTDDAHTCVVHNGTSTRASGHRSTGEREKVERERERERAHEREKSKSRGNSTTSKSQHHHSSSNQHHPEHSDRKSREHKKPSIIVVQKQHSAATTPTTYVYKHETNLVETQTVGVNHSSEECLTEAVIQTIEEYDTHLQIKTEEHIVNASDTATCEQKHEVNRESLQGDGGEPSVSPPLPPPRTRRKRFRSLIPIPVNSKIPPSIAPTSARTSASVLVSSSPSFPSPSPPPIASITYEHQTYAHIIPLAPRKTIEPTYSNQSTLRKVSLLRGLRKRSALPLPLSLSCRRKPSQTQSTTSSFAFLPYLPAEPGKRPSDASHIYHNYLLYATPTKIKAKCVSVPQPPAEVVALWSSNGISMPPMRPQRSRQRLRTIRSHVSTHHPFGLCTCS